MKKYHDYKQMLPLVGLENLWEEEQARHGLESYGKTGKYLRKIDDYFPEKMQCYEAMGLKKSGPKKILDIGTGVGYFPWLCDQNGHACDYTDSDPLPFYTGAHKLLQLKGRYLNLTVKGMERFELPDSYDIITGHRTVFDIFDYHWYLDEWRCFLGNCADYLHDDGFVFIKTNLVQGAHLHTPHPAWLKFIEPYLLDGFNSFTFKISKDQILNDLG